jgi:hypothetical protein
MAIWPYGNMARNRRHLSPAIQRIELAGLRKAPVSDNKMTLASLSGGTVSLGSPKAFPGIRPYLSVDSCRREGGACNRPRFPGVEFLPWGPL